MPVRLTINNSTPPSRGALWALRKRGLRGRMGCPRGRNRKRRGGTAHCAGPAGRRTVHARRRGRVRGQQQKASTRAWISSAMTSPTAARPTLYTLPTGEPNAWRLRMAALISAY